MEALWSAVSTGELLLVTADAPARFFSLRLLNGCLCDAHDQAAKHAQNQCRIGIADPAAILVEGHIQGVMQTALNDPIAALEFHPTQRVELL